MGHLYLGAALVLGAVFTWYAARLLRDRTPQAAMRVFGWSITYITLLFGAMAVDQLHPIGLVVRCLVFRGPKSHVTRFPSTASLLTRVRS